MVFLHQFDYLSHLHHHRHLSPPASPRQGFDSYEIAKTRLVRIGAHPCVGHSGTFGFILGRFSLLLGLGGGSCTSSNRNRTPCCLPLRRSESRAIASGSHLDVQAGTGDCCRSDGDNIRIRSDFLQYFVLPAQLLPNRTRGQCDPIWCPSPSACRRSDSLLLYIGLPSIANRRLLVEFGDRIRRLDDRAWTAFLD